MEGILRRVARKPYRSTIDGQDAYEQIRVITEHIPRTAVTTPDRNMVSLVVQQGDCNAPATYQALMNHIFGMYIGIFMDVYLDDIIIYSDMLEEHMEHVTIILNILKREKLYLSEKKLRFLCKEVKILGRIVTNDGICMDPEKVDSILNWKVPTNRTLCKGFIGSVGYLADDIFKVRVPLGVLSEACAETRPFRWSYTEQRAFDMIKQYVSSCAPHSRVPLEYRSDRDPIWVMTDACGNGIGGVIAQGKDWENTKVAAFYSAKMSSAQRNYPVHEQELLAGVETMLRHRDILQGIPFTWVTDHKGLIHILDQKGLSGRQARWMEKLSEFDFKVKYVAGEENILPDALSRLYEYDEPGTIRAPEEYLQYDANVEASTTSKGLVLSAPLFVGAEALAISPRWSSRLQQGAKEVTPTPVPPRSSRPTPPATKTKQRTGQEGPPVASTSAGTQPRATRKGPPPPTETGQLETGAVGGGWVLLLPQVRHARPRGFWRSGRAPKD